MKITNNKCKYCKHYIWGYSTSTQQNEVRVCENRPKIVRSDVSYHPKQYHYATYPNKSCSDFELNENL